MDLFTPLCRECNKEVGQKASLKMLGRIFSKARGETRQNQRRGCCHRYQPRHRSFCHPRRTRRHPPCDSSVISLLSGWLQRKRRRAAPSIIKIQSSSSKSHIVVIYFACAAAVATSLAFHGRIASIVTIIRVRRRAI